MIIKNCDNFYVNMNTKLLILLFLIFVLTGCAANQTSMKQTDFALLIPEMEKKSDLVRQFRADFVKVKHSSIFNRDLVVNGSLLFQKPGNFQLTFTGDVNIEILSNRKVVTLIHDGKDQEYFFIHGERDASRMSDPLMSILQNMGNGGLRKFAVTNQTNTQEGLKLELKPSNDSQFERIRNVDLDLSSGGEIDRVAILYANGDKDETTFSKWMMLTSDDPEIVKLNEKLARINGASPESDYKSSHNRPAYSNSHEMLENVALLFD
jgi:outer membrane lipoprotein-sorting protein